MAVSDCIRTCRNCGAHFRRTTKGQPTKFCGHDCRLKHKRAKDRVKPRSTPKPKTRPCRVCGQVEMARGLCSRHYLRLISKGTTGLVCGWCGKTHDQDGKHMCSAECRAAALRARKTLLNARRRARIESGDRIDPIRVFERDGWRCHLCGISTPIAKRGTYEPNAPELDHIIALADGGQHTWGNVACACRACNGAKKAQSRGQLGLEFAA